MSISSKSNRAYCAVLSMRGVKLVQDVESVLPVFQINTTSKTMNVFHVLHLMTTVVNVKPETDAPNARAKHFILVSKENVKAVLIC